MPNTILSVIAIDGPAASGKSTIASLLSKRLNGCYVSTGNMYRAVTLAIYKENIPFPIPETFPLKNFLFDLNLIFHINNHMELSISLDSQPVDAEIRSPVISSMVSDVAKLPLIRSWLVQKQRSIAQNFSGFLIMEGRDIGTVVFPDARFKFFLTASPQVRAQRRLAQSGEVCVGATISTVADEIARRDQLDSTRAESPLKKAENSLLVDSSDLSIQQVVDYLYNYIISK